MGFPYGKTKPRSPPITSQPVNLIAAATLPVPAVRFPEGVSAEEALAVERPLQLTVNGQAFAVLMRTPGMDRELVVGLLLGDGILAVAGVPLIQIELNLGTGDCDEARLTIPEPYVCPNLEAHRSLASGTACGICGQRRWQSLDLPQLPPAPAPDVAGFVRQLRLQQPLFSLTGGTHAAVLFDANGAVLASAEDVGRHNAVDKVIGATALASDLPPAAQAACLVVSGRLAYELVAKAWRAGIPAIAAVSAPTSAAVSLAQRANLRLYGFCRDDRATCYTPEILDHA